MSFSEVYESTRGQKTEFMELGSGYTTLRFLTKPVAVNRAFLPYIDADGSTKKKSFWVYKGCGYEDEGKTKFVAYVLDPKDERDEEGKLKVKKIEVGWTVLSSLADKEKMRKEQGMDVESFPMLTDIIISKTGTMMNTKYACDFAVRNQTTATKEEIDVAIATLEPLEDWRHKSTEAEKKSHEEKGLPKFVKKVAKDESLPTVQLNDEQPLPPDDIPW